MAIIRPAGIFCALVLLLFSHGSVAAEKLVISAQDLYFTSTCRSIAREALANIGITVEYRAYPGARALQMADSGAVDGELGRIKGIEKRFPNLIRVDSMLAPAVAHVFSGGPEFAVEGWHSLKPYSIAIHRGHVYAQAGTRGMRAVAVETDLQILKMLKHGRTDIAVMVTLDGLKTRHDARFEGIKVLSPRLLTVSVYLYLHRKHARLVPSIGASLQEMADNGRRIAIYEEFLKRIDVEPDIFRELVDAYGSSIDP